MHAKLCHAYFALDVVSYHCCDTRRMQICTTCSEFPGAHDSTMYAHKGDRIRVHDADAGRQLCGIRPCYRIEGNIALGICFYTQVHRGSLFNDLSVSLRGTATCLDTCSLRSPPSASASKMLSAGQGSSCSDWLAAPRHLWVGSQ